MISTLFLFTISWQCVSSSLGNTSFVNKFKTFEGSIKSRWMVFFLENSHQCMIIIFVSVRWTEQDKDLHVDENWGEKNTYGNVHVLCCCAISLAYMLRCGRMLPGICQRRYWRRYEKRESSSQFSATICISASQQPLSISGKFLLWKHFQEFLTWWHGLISCYQSLSEFLAYNIVYVTFCPI